MKHIVIGDLHGRDIWQTINFNPHEKIIFLGDYVDSFTLSDAAILRNFQQVVELKKREPDKVVLLLGNHDAQYLHYPDRRCSGFRESMQKGLTYLFKRDKALFSPAYQIKNHLFTHAGVSTVWYRELMRLPIVAN